MGKQFKMKNRFFENITFGIIVLLSFSSISQSVAIASPENKNNWECALSEAAFMTGLERNADVVHLTSYAPLMAHAEGWQWTPDLLWFNNLNSYGTPNYYVQKLFATNKGTDLVSVSENGKSLVGQHSLYASAVTDTVKRIDH